MAKDAAVKEAKSPSVVMLMLALLVLTLVAGGGGAFVGRQIMAFAKAANARTSTADGPKSASATAVKELTPIVTNLAAPDGAWIRLQTAIVYDKTDAAKIDILAGEIVDDTMAYIKTLTVTQLQGASGLQHLREDLNERASLRSEGHVHEVIIEALVIE